MFYNRNISYEQYNTNGGRCNVLRECVSCHVKVGRIFMEQFMKLRYVNVLGHKTSNTSLLQPHHYHEGGKYYKAMMG